MSDLVEWRCKAGHVLGLMKRDSSKAWRLLLYREALDMSAGATHPEVDLVGVVFGDATINCSVCDEKLTWIGDPEALRKRAERMGKRQR